MSKTAERKELETLLRPFITDCGATRDSVYPESVEDLIGFAECTGVEEKLIDYVKKHPKGPFWDFLNLIPPGYDDGDVEEDDDE